VFSRKIHAGSSRLGIVLGATAVALAFVAAGAAHANWYLTKTGAQRSAKDFVAGYYSNTYVSDLTTYCRPHRDPYDPYYKYHRWNCGWYDSSDGTSGAVRIVGRRGAGYYYGRVLG
jgi:hypothetical protein